MSDDTPTQPSSTRQHPDSRAETAIEPPPAPLLPDAPPLPSRIGNYSIIGRLGEGGMGIVYEARQEHPSRTVALKVIRASRLSSELLRRFGHETEVLGRLQHPGIAQIYEAGTATDETGRSLPFFAMELVKGVPLTDFARVHQLPTRARLELLAKVCDAVEHAHQKGVIHRDLKPANILVDQSGQIKILDFGVARAIGSDMQRTTQTTHIGQLVGTLPYMSPEQVAGDPRELDTRSDVYALGVIGFELLAGCLPYALDDRLLHEALRIIKEDEPTRFSSIDKAMRGDVETIVRHALEKEKSRRYQAASALASDIRRYLNDEPISARPASALYQAGKFARRHKGLVAGLATGLALLTVGLVATAVSRHQAIVARDAEAAARADSERLGARLLAQRDKLRETLLTVGNELEDATGLSFDIPADPAETEDDEDSRITALGDFTVNAIRKINNVNRTLRSSVEDITGNLQEASGLDFEIPDGDGDSESGEDERIKALSEFTVRAVQKINTLTDALQETLSRVESEAQSVANLDESLASHLLSESQDETERVSGLGDFAISAIHQISAVNTTLQSSAETLSSELGDLPGMDFSEAGASYSEGDDEDIRIKGLADVALAAGQRLKAVDQSLDSAAGTLYDEAATVDDLELPDFDGISEDDESARVTALADFAVSLIRRLRDLQAASFTK